MSIAIHSVILPCFSLLQVLDTLFFFYCIHLIKLEWIHMKWAILKIIFRVNHTAHQWLGTTANLIIESKLANGVDVDVLCPNLSLHLQIIVFFFQNMMKIIILCMSQLYLFTAKQPGKVFQPFKILLCSRFTPKSKIKNCFFHWHIQNLCSAHQRPSWGWSLAHLDCGYSEIHPCGSFQTLSGVFLYLCGKVSHPNDVTILELMYHIIYKHLSAREEWTQQSSVPWDVWLSDWMAVYIFLTLMLC